jgi:hypothetical protein
MRFLLLLLPLLLLSRAGHSGEPAPIPDTPFWQDFHEAAPLPTPDENDVRAVVLDRGGRLWAATRAGVRFREGCVWHAPEGAAVMGIAYSLCLDSGGRVWVGASDGVWLATPARVYRSPLPAPQVTPIAAVTARGRRIYAAGPDGIWRTDDGAAWARVPGAWHRAVRTLLAPPDGRLWIGTASGLYIVDPEGAGPPRVLGTPDTLLSSNITGLAELGDGEIAVAGTGGVDLYRGGKRVRSLSGAQGMPEHRSRAVARDADGRLWIATERGVARFDGREWRLRHSRRWLASDDARSVAIGPDGAAWVATAAGVDVIRRRRMTLAEKAEYYLGVLRARHLRPPGLVGPAVLAAPGDLSRSFIEDDDNDGEHTGMYLAMESMRYAVTRDPAARANARDAFRALQFLQRATGTRHFIARSVLPAGTPPRHEVDRTYTPEQTADSRRDNPRGKIIEKRWIPTADGRWLWKRDASSDEVDGHLFGYFTYFDLAADDAEKREVADQVDRIVGGIVDHGYVLADIDGKGTQWGNWSPESLNRDPTWHEERSGNSAEILAHLGVAYHVTGKEKYREAARMLIEKHGYALNVAALRFPTPSERTHINDELLSMVFPELFSHLVLPSLRPAALAAIRQWHVTCRRDHTPFYDFVYNRFSGRRVPLAPAVENLREWPLDLVEWTVDNRGRNDVTPDRTPGADSDRLSRILPRSELGLCMWDGDPYQAVRGRGGEREEKPTDWLLAYWMGRYYRLLAAP